MQIFRAANRYLIDTGQPRRTSALILDNYRDGDREAGLHFYQSFAVAFSVADHTRIDSLDAYLRLPVPGRVAFELREGSGRTGKVLCRGMAAVGSRVGWYGLAGLNQSVSAGTYTLSLLPDSGTVGGSVFLGAPAASRCLAATWVLLRDGSLHPAGPAVLTPGIRVGRADPGAPSALGVWAALVSRRRSRPKGLDEHALPA